MEVFQVLFSSALSVMKVEFTLLGFTFSMWDIFLWALVAGIVLSAVGGYFND